MKLSPAIRRVVTLLAASTALTLSISGLPAEAAPVAASTTWSGSGSDISTAPLDGGTTWQITAQSSSCQSVVAKNPAAVTVQDCSVSLTATLVGNYATCTGGGFGTAVITQSGVPGPTLPVSIAVAGGDGGYTIGLIGVGFQYGSGTFANACNVGETAQASWLGHADYV